MTTKVTKESLAARVRDFQWRISIGGTLSLKEEYQLEAHKMLFALLEKEDDKR